MAKVNFKRIETDNDLDDIEVQDGNFIVTGNGKVYIDYGSRRLAVGGSPDLEMSDTSTNSIQNKIVKRYIDNIKNKTDKNFNFSTEEQEIGTWIDGKTLYRKVCHGTGWDNTLIAKINNLSQIVSMKGVIKSIYNQWWNIPNYFAELNYCTSIKCDKDEVRLITGAFFNENSEYFITIEYTKINDEEVTT